MSVCHICGNSEANGPEFKLSLFTLDLLVKNILGLNGFHFQ